MRNFIATVVLCGSLTLGGCATTGGGGGPDVAAIIAQVQQISVQVCKFLPTAATIAAIVTAGQLTEAFGIANAVCAAVSGGAQAARTAKVPTVSGVVIHGRFV